MKKTCENCVHLLIPKEGEARCIMWLMEMPLDGHCNTFDWNADEHS